MGCIQSYSNSAYLLSDKIQHLSFEIEKLEDLMLSIDNPHVTPKTQHDTLYHLWYDMVSAAN